jgi:ABC-type dipeptide/oligopeptide/nickel transport system permease component
LGEEGVVEAHVAAQFRQTLRRRAALGPLQDQLVPVLFLISIIVFGVLHALPGDPAELILQGAEGGAPPERLAELRRNMGLDDPLLTQYLRF